MLKIILLIVAVVVFAPLILAVLFGITKLLLKVALIVGLVAAGVALYKKFVAQKTYH